MFFSKKFVLTGESGQEVGAVVFEHLWADVYGIQLKKSETEIPLELWLKEIGSALVEAELHPARQVLFRLIADKDSHEFSKNLPSLGFLKKQDRVEFRKLVGELPDDQGTSLRWQTAEELNWNAEMVAITLSSIAQGDPDHDPADDPLLFIQDFLVDPVLTAGLGCIHVGFMGDEIAAMTVVQINSKSGWSRISYMGVVPKFRTLGLGKWVHRYSFVQMKKQGGKLYHGGTVSTNTRMIRLFESHGCAVYRQMEEWIYLTKRGRH